VATPKRRPGGHRPPSAAAVVAATARAPVTAAATRLPPGGKTADRALPAANRHRAERSGTWASSAASPAPGWGFTVVLTGQDGFSPDQARGFTPTPQEFQFGVCPAPSADPHCTADLATVPKA
jgi:hypothetical protein